MAIQAQPYMENLGFQFGGAQDWMANSYGFNEFCFYLQQQKQQYMNLQQTNQNLCFDYNSVLLPKNSNHQSMAFSHTIASQIEKQRQEIDQFISIENERLRLALEEQRKQQMGSFLKQYESKTQILLRQKDEEISKGMYRRMELEETLRRMESEKQTWQRLASENEAMAISLNNTIEQLRESTACPLINGVEDAESCCDSDTIDKTEENRGHEYEHENQQITCKSCNSRISCFVFLPCRHLCSCKACEAFLDSCPVCRMVKKARIEALF